MTEPQPESIRLVPHRDILATKLIKICPQLKSPRSRKIMSAIKPGLKGKWWVLRNYPWHQSRHFQNQRSFRSQQLRPPSIAGQWHRSQAHKIAISGDVPTMPPHPVRYAHRKGCEVIVRTGEILQPKRTLGILRIEERPRISATEKLARYIASRFDDLRQLSKRHEDAIGRGEGPPDAA